MRSITRSPESIREDVWAIDHIRAAIFAQLDLRHAHDFLTLDKATFITAAKTIYRHVLFEAYVKSQTQFLFIPPDRFTLYRNSVKHLDWTGSMPFMGNVPGGLPTLLVTFPQLQTMTCDSITATINTSSDVSYTRTCTIVKKIRIFYGKWRGSYKHHLPPTWNTTVLYHMELVKAQYMWDKLLESQRPPPALKLRISNLEWRIGRCRYNEGIKRLVQYRQKSLLPGIEHLEFGSLPMYWPAFKELPLFLGQSTKTLKSAVAIIQDITDERFWVEYFNHDPDWIHNTLRCDTSLADLLVDFDWGAFESLKKLTLHTKVYLLDLNPCSRLLHHFGTNPRLPQPLYAGLPLDLDDFTFNLDLIFKKDLHTTGMHGSAYDMWVQDNLPDPHALARALVAIGGRGCRYIVTLSLNQDRTEGVIEAVYYYRVRKALDEICHGDVGWVRGVIPSQSRKRKGEPE